MNSNTIPILALVGAEIFSLMAFVGVCEVHAKDIALCESRWALVLPAIALAGQSTATYFMDSSRQGGLGPGGHGPAGPGGGGGADGGMASGVVRQLPPRNRMGRFRSSSEEEEDDALAA